MHARHQIIQLIAVHKSGASPLDRWGVATRGPPRAGGTARMPEDELLALAASPFAPSRAAAAPPRPSFKVSTTKMPALRGSEPTPMDVVVDDDDEEEAAADADDAVPFEDADAEALAVRAAPGSEAYAFDPNEAPPPRRGAQLPPIAPHHAPRAPGAAPPLPATPTRPGGSPWGAQSSPTSSGPAPHQSPPSPTSLVRHLPSHRRIPPHLREMILRPPTSPDQHFDFDVDAIRRQLRGDIA